MRVFLTFFAALFITLEFLEMGVLHGVLSLISFGVGLCLSRLT